MFLKKIKKFVEKTMQSLIPVSNKKAKKISLPQEILNTEILNKTIQTDYLLELTSNSKHSFMSPQISAQERYNVLEQNEDAIIQNLNLSVDSDEDLSVRDFGVYIHPSTIDELSKITLTCLKKYYLKKGLLNNVNDEVNYSPLESKFYKELSSQTDDGCLDGLKEMWDFHAHEAIFKFETEGYLYKNKLSDFNWS